MTSPDTGASPDRALFRWRAATLAACVGWAATVWLGWPAPAEHTAPTVHRATPTRAVVKQAAVSPRVPVARQAALPTPAAAPRAADHEALRAELREEILAELDAERRARDAERADAHLGRLLEDVAAFSQAHDLTYREADALEVAFLAMHDRMEALRHSDLSREARGDAAVAAREQLEADVYASLEDEADADALLDQMRRPPGPPPGGPRRP